MASKKEIPGLNIALLDILTGALGAVIILFVTVPKGVKDTPATEKARGPSAEEMAKESKESLSKKIQIREEVIKKLSQKIQNLEMESRNKESISEAKIRELQDKMKYMSAEIEQNNYQGKGLPVDVGFDFKGRNIVFIIDVSGSMNREDRIGQVKAGLKMLITSMPKDYNLDVVAFPNHPSAYRPLWGGLKALDEFNKDHIYRYLLNLRAVGFTPTAQVLNYAFDTYPNATDFVLLSDGAPTKGNSKIPDNISEILINVKQRNKKNIRISTIGVGSSFLDRKDSSAYVFLQELARDHGGFFVGF
ncbi:MAG: hypothetical protein CME60_09940 [Halobacteriovoraceae bacterium]|nr:hypothetical protein [Halobacteriovoraceae bacterium]